MAGSSNLPHGVDYLGAQRRVAIACIADERSQVNPCGVRRQCRQAEGTGRDGGRTRPREAAFVAEFARSVGSPDTCGESLAQLTGVPWSLTEMAAGWPAVSRMAARMTTGSSPRFSPKWVYGPTRFAQKALRRAPTGSRPPLKPACVNYHGVALPTAIRHP